MPLKLNGAVFSLTVENPALKRMRGYLESAPADELLTTPQLAERCDVRQSSIQRYKVELRDHWHPWRSTTVWGSKKAIAEFRRQLKARQ